ncbi:hypothetical protein FGO68_gene8564 [Halteria grandinella]|uniref:Uncharacterized protein n=1 Tax=Halteria grandinella TaxID=5974 RepID=A0A8J8NA47_HALGN|nr:hypothetical protein FGO68_gene8564 [Halteria grandinella]
MMSLMLMSQLDNQWRLQNLEIIWNTLSLLVLCQRKMALGIYLSLVKPRRSKKCKRLVQEFMILNMVESLVNLSLSLLIECGAYH